MKFVHMADVHFDRPFVSNRYSKKLIQQRRLDQRNAFYEAICYTKEIKADMLLIAGDLFEQQYVEEDTIKYIISCLQKIPEVAIFIAPGNHDPLIPTSPYLTQEWPENVTIFTSEVGKFEYDDVVVYGLGFSDYEMESHAIEEIVVDKNKINILVTHGTLDGATHIYHDIKSKSLSSFDYVALGHIHMPKIDDSRMIYPGSLVSGGLDELGEHGMVIGELTKEECKLEFKEMDPRRFEEVTLTLTEEDEEKNVHDILERLSLGKNVYRVILHGTKISKIPELIELLKSEEYFVCDIQDETKLKYNLKEIAMQNNLKGLFTKKMLQELEDHPEERQEIEKAIELVYEIL